MKQYVLVGWPEIQDFMVHPRWNECVFCTQIEGHPVDDNTYAVPVDLYKKVGRPSYKLEGTIGEPVLWEGIKVTPVKGDGDGLSCKKCYFYNLKQCDRINCSVFERKDDEDVYFIKTEQ